MKLYKKIYIKLLVYLGKAVDISSSGHYPADVLSNIKGNKFTIDGIECGSMEGFLQALKQDDAETQRHLCALKGREARRRATRDWQRDQRLWWQGQPIGRESDEYRALLCRAYDTLFEQNVAFRMALLSTKGKRLFYSHGRHNPKKTILTEQEFCQILTDLRAKNADRKTFGTGSRH
ncbi:MAG: hypothetical protein IJ620_02975 [Bacteroidales bacterium]|nr:hypothetical protein [Bacteroidales bacterium]